MLANVMEKLRPATDAGRLAAAAVAGAVEIETGKASRYTLYEVTVDYSLPTAVLITAEPRYNASSGDGIDKKNPVLITPTPGGTAIRVLSARYPHDEPISSTELVAEAIRRVSGEDSPHASGRPGVASHRLRDERIGLFDYYSMARQIAWALNAGYDGPEGKSYNYHVHEWVNKRAGQAIKDRLHGWWRRTVDSLESSRPDVVGLQRAVFAATFSAPDIVYDERVYERPYLVADVMRYRAAALALANLTALGRNLGYRPEIHDDDHVELLDRMNAGRWRGLFSADGESYKALNKTLDNLPGGVPATLINGLAGVRLSQPITERAPLVMACLYGIIAGYRRGGADNAESRPLARCFATATTGRIKRAMAVAARYNHRELSYRRAADLRYLAGFLMDFPGSFDHEGGIVSLAERTARWHREEAHGQAMRMAATMGGQTRAAAPPIEPPAAKRQGERLEFLQTVERIVAEGERMNNCVGSYARSAVEGRSYLFHAEARGETATVEVHPEGFVVQSQGPFNRRNHAATWAARTLGQWAKGFPERQRRIARAGADPDLDDVFGDLDGNGDDDIPF